MFLKRERKGATLEVEGSVSISVRFIWKTFILYKGDFLFFVCCFVYNLQFLNLLNDCLLYVICLSDRCHLFDAKVWSLCDSLNWCFGQL